MKLITLASKYLKFMVKSYHDECKNSFQFDEFKNLQPDVGNDHISGSLTILEQDGLVRISSYNNMPYFVYLDVSAVKNAEEDTLLKKGYTFIKEIKSWI